VLPGQLGICVFSPPLDPRGNSVRGVEACQRMAADLELHFLHATRPSRAAIRSRHDVASAPSKRIRPPADRDALLALGTRAVCYELQGDLLFGGIERVVRSIVERAGALDAVILDLGAVAHLSAASAAMLVDLRDALAAANVAFALIDHPAEPPRLGAELARLPAFADRDAATEWAEELLLGERPRHGAVEPSGCQLFAGLSAE